jgi:hypothetical protein
MDPRVGFVAVDMHISVDDDEGWNGASRGDPTTKAEIVGIKRAIAGTKHIMVSTLWDTFVEHSYALPGIQTAATAAQQLLRSSMRTMLTMIL